MAINPTQVLIDALKALRDSDPREINIVDVVLSVEPYNIFRPISSYFNSFMCSATVDFAGIQERNIAAIDAIIQLLNIQGADANSTALEQMFLEQAGLAFSFRYWGRLGSARYDKLTNEFAELKTDLARLTDGDDNNRQYLRVCRENDGLTRRITELELELSHRPTATNPS